MCDGFTGLSESWQLRGDSGDELSTTGILTLISYLLPPLPFYMAASRDDIRALGTALARGSVCPAVGGTCVHACSLFLSPRRHTAHTFLTVLLPHSRHTDESQVKVSVETNKGSPSRCSLMVIARQGEARASPEM